MNSETITKEIDTSGVFYRRIVQDANGNVVSDERVKKDPVLAFTQPAVATFGEATSVTVSIDFRLRDFDGELRTDSGIIQFRLRDRDAPGDEGVLFTRQLVSGELTLLLEIDTPGEYVLTIDPPLVADMHLPEPVRVEVA